MRRIVSSVLCTLLLGATLLEAQSSGRPRGTPTSRGRGAGPTSAASRDEPLPTFRGVFHSAAGGKLYLDTEDSNQLEFYVSRKTVFYEGDKKLKLNDLKNGARISVEAKRVIATRMDALTVRLESAR